MSALEDRLHRFAHEWHEAMSSTYAVNMQPMLLEVASDARRLVAPTLEADNAKLRELVRQMHTCLTRPKVYAGTSQPYLIATECPYFTQGVCDYNSCGFERRMRELGIEVAK